MTITSKELNDHKVYLKSDFDKIGGNDYYYILINSLPNSDFTDTTSNIVINILNLAGIPLNEINSNYPININQVNGFLLVTDKHPSMILAYVPLH